MIIFSGSAFQNLHTLVKRLPGTFVLEDFDPLRLKVEIREKEKRDYTVLYHALAAPYSFWIYVRCLIFLTIDIPPEHYQIWTPLQGSTHSRKSRYDFLNYVRPAGIRRLFSGATSSKQREIVSDLDLMGVSHLHKSAQAISSLRFIGVAQEKGTPILLALLTQHADAPHLVEVVKLLETIAHELETQQ